MVYIALAIAVGLFSIGLRVTGIVSRARGVLSGVNQALAVMRAPDLTDDEKAATIRIASLSMFAAFFSILMRTAIAIAVPLAFILLCVAAGLFAADRALAASMEWQFIAASAVLVTVFLVVRR